MNKEIKETAKTQAIELGLRCLSLLGQAIVEFAKNIQNKNAKLPVVTPQNFEAKQDVHQ